MRKSVRLLMLSTIITLGCCTITFANYKDFVDLTTKNYNLSPEDAKEHSFWKQSPGGWQYYDCHGDLVTGYFFDARGDFYYAKEDGYILLSDKDIWNQEYGQDGRLINAGYSGYNNDYFKEKCLELESGSNVEFSTLAELYDFIEFYGKEFNVGSQSLVFRAYKKKSLNELGEVKSITYFTNNSRNTLYSRDKTMDLFNKKFTENLVGNTVKEKLKSACDSVKIIQYSDKHLGVSMETALTENKGGCWHLAKLVHLLLERDGIVSEVVTGKSYGVPHMWLRVRDENNNWIYCDPTYYVNGLEEYLSVDYKVYTDNYRTNRFFTR